MKVELVRRSTPDRIPNVRHSSEQTTGAVSIQEKSMSIVFLGVAITLSVVAAFPADPAKKPVKVAEAPALELELKHESLENVEDKAGRWQFEGGKVYARGKHVANYASTKRMVNKGTDDQNTAMVTTTIFFLGEKPPENITLQGAHDFGSGDQTGSVSAASSEYKAYIGKSFVRQGNKITIR
jgi:hypothetical protein